MADRKITDLTQRNRSYLETNKANVFWTGVNTGEASPADQNNKVIDFDMFGQREQGSVLYVSNNAVTSTGVKGDRSRPYLASEVMAAATSGDLVQFLPDAWSFNAAALNFAKSGVSVWYMPGGTVTVTGNAYLHNYVANVPTVEIDVRCDADLILNTGVAGGFIDYNANNLRCNFSIKSCLSTLAQALIQLDTANGINIQIGSHVCNSGQTVRALFTCTEINVNIGYLENNTSAASCINYDGSTWVNAECNSTGACFSAIAGSIYGRITNQGITTVARLGTTSSILSYYCDTTSGELISDNSNRGYISASLRNTQVRCKGSGKLIVTGDHENVTYLNDSSENFDIIGARMEGCTNTGVGSTTGTTKITACRGDLTQSNAPENITYRGCDLDFNAVFAITSGVGANRKIRFADGIYRWNFNGDGITFVEGSSIPLNIVFDNCYLVKDTAFTGDIIDFQTTSVATNKITFSNVKGICPGGGVVLRNGGATAVTRAMYNDSYVSIANVGAFTDVITGGGIFVVDVDVTEF